MGRSVAKKSLSIELNEKAFSDFGSGFVVVQHSVFCGVFNRRPKRND